MRKQLHGLHSLYKSASILTIFVWVFALTGSAQFTNTTVPPLSGGNGSGGSTFNLTVTAPILLTEVGQAFYGPATTATYEIWMSNTAISGPPNITTANGWTMIQTGSVTGLSNGLTPVVASVPLNSPMLLTPGTYGFYVSGSSNVVYTTYNASNQTTFTDAFTTIETGPGVGYGGSLPNPSFSTRQFNGSVTYVPASTGPDNVALTSIITPGTYCAGSLDSLSVKVANYGSNQVDSFMVVWDINSVMDSAWFIAALDTFSGTFNNDTIITLDTLTMPAGATNISVWTKWPNGVQDTDTSNDSASANYLPALAGTKIIDAAGTGDYISFTDAVNDLDNFGVCGPVIFEVVDGSYIEQIELKNYVGMSSTNTVTFQSQSGNAAGVILSYSAASFSDNYVVNFNGAAYFTIKNITMQSLGTSYARVITTPTSGGNDHITIDGCVLEGVTTTSTWQSGMYVSYIYGVGNDYWTITNNTFLNGNYGLYFYGNYSANGKNNIISNNEFLDQYYRAAYVYYQDDLMFTNNHVFSNSTYTSAYATFIGRVKNGEISGNFIEGTMNWPRFGFYLSQVEGDLTTFMPVYNNRVYMPSASGSYGMYITSNLFVDYSHNSVFFASSSTFGRAWYMSSGGYNKVLNNSIQNIGSGQAVYISGSPVYLMDYNNLSAPNGDVGYLGQAYTSLADWQAATSYDSNSVSVNDVYSDTATLKVCTDSLYQKGMYSALYPIDFEGDVRQDPPSIGADEFMPISEFGFDDSPVLCTGDTLLITQYFYDTVVWNGNDTSNVFAVTTPGQVTVAVFDGCGTGSDTFDVVPQQVSSLGDTNLCEGTSAVLGTGISNGTYLWSNGSTDSTVMVDSAQVLSVQIVDEYGCSSVANSNVTQSMDVALNDVDSFCQGSNLVLDAGVTGTYTWNDGSSNQTLSVSAAGTYSVTVIDQNCTSFDAVTVYEILNAVPSFTDSSDHFTVAFTNTTQNANSYLWDFGDGTTSTQENPIHVYPWSTDSVGLYTVTLTAYNFCGDNEFVNDGVRAGQLVSVSELDLASMVSVYPNPNNGVFSVVVKTDEAMDMSIQVLDARGALVYTNSFGTINGEVNRTINLEGAAQGIYFVKVTLNDETAVYRLSVN